ncbi:hypothetical protein [Paractinoplanes ferrugineus]|nr:hypothetical protein [Actinoplanes ferrugineus]
MIDRWPHLRALHRQLSKYPSVEAWIFGSALVSPIPKDIDVLLMYSNRDDIKALREADYWGDYVPPIHIIAMTHSEEMHYRFKTVTRAVRLLPATGLQAGRTGT